MAQASKVRKFRVVYESNTGRRAMICHATEGYSTPEDFPKIIAFRDASFIRILHMEELADACLSVR